MKVMIPPTGFSSRNSFVLAVLVGCAAQCTTAFAQQGYGQPSYYGQQGNSDRWNNFYQKGDEISDRVSGFMRRIFNGNQTRQQPSYATPTAQPQAPTYYQQPAPTAAPSTGVYGYSTPPSSTPTSASKPVQPATRKSSTTASRPSIFTRKVKVKTESPPSPAATKTYEPPRIEESPPPAKTTTAAQETKFDPKPEPSADTKFQPKAAPKIDPGLEPGTTVDSSGKPSSNLGSIVTESPKPSTTSTAVQGDSIPVGKKGSFPNSVFSPYPPYTELDITGMGSGSKVKDPTTGKAFLIP